MATEDEAPIRVLMVEDNSTHAYLVERHLMKIGQDAVVLEQAHRLETALTRLDQGGIDALLLDLSLPDSNIDETLPRVIESHREVPIIVLTSLDDLDFATKAVAQGAQDFLVKSDLNGPVLMRSITYAIERQKTQERLESFAAELEATNERLKGFAHTVAHEVKSPLTVVSSCLQLLKQHYYGEIEAEHWGIVEDAESAVRGLTAMVNDLLEFSRMGKTRPNFKEIDLEAAFYHTYVCLRAKIKETNATVTHDPLPTVFGSEVQLRQLLINLIGNALVYRSSVPPVIHVTAIAHDAHWTISVQDNGLGIPEAEQTRIFEAFVRVHDQEQIPGSGIGLALCQQIVENHGGRIWVDSEPGNGSTFSFTLPT